MVSNEDMNLMKKLKTYLEHFDLTAAQVSRKSGVSQQVISQWLRGAEPKKLTQVKNVAEVFGCSVDHLCFGEGIDRVGEAAQLIPQDEWLSGLFEVKIRRIK
jgi:transcriptional regulator with XRE-family HTH domain